MRIRSLAGLLMVLMACSHGGGTDRPAYQENFGVQMARMNLWREAMFRFRRAVEMDPASAMAHNNLAVSYEANGDFENAQKEYREALRLDRSNQYIQKNYSRFVEFMSRNKKRQQKADEKKDEKTDAAPKSRPDAVAPPTPAPPGSAPPSPPPVAPAPNPPGGLR